LVALPGVAPEKVDVSIADDIVTIRGVYEEEHEHEDAGYVHRELTRGDFSRTFALPTSINVDAATAHFRGGLLTLTLPKAETVRPKHVKVEVKR
jgi:HSP20 family protein